MSCSLAHCRRGRCVHIALGSLYIFSRNPSEWLIAVCADVPTQCQHTFLKVVAKDLDYLRWAFSSSMISDRCKTAVNVFCFSNETWLIRYVNGCCFDRLVNFIPWMYARTQQCSKVRCGGSVGILLGVIKATLLFVLLWVSSPLNDLFMRLTISSYNATSISSGPAAVLFVACLTASMVMRSVLKCLSIFGSFHWPPRGAVRSH